MTEQLFPVSFTKTLQILSYNDKQDWWEGEAYFGKFAFWLEVDSEKYIYYCNFLKIKEDGGLEPIPDVVQGIFISPSGEAALIQDNTNRYFISQPVDLMPRKTKDDGLYCSVVFWFLFQKGPAFVVPERPNLLRYEFIDSKVSEEQQQANELKILDWKILRESRKQEAQEQKEQTEREWKEWEKRQKEDNN